MKISKATLEQIIREELEEITSENPFRTALEKGAGLPPRPKTTKVGRPDPVMPQELGPEDDPEREDEELPEISQKEAINAFIEAFRKLDKKKQKFLRRKENKENLNFVLNQFIRDYQMGAIEGTSKNIEDAWNRINEGYEHEGSMARNQLGRTAELATMIQGMISDDTNLEEWVESKITKAQDYLSSVLNYMRGESSSKAQEDDEPAENYALEKMQNALLKLVPGYDLDKKTELMVRDELIELIKNIRAAKK